MSRTRPMSTFRIGNTSARIFPWLLFAFLLPTLAWAGGVVQELLVSPHALTSGKDVTKAPDQATPHQPTKADPKKKEEKPELVSLFYDPVREWTVIRWRPFHHEGQRAIGYHIYRWNVQNPQRELIGRVNGDVFEYVDRSGLAAKGYTYKVVGIYHVKGKYQTWQYPALQLSKEPQPPPAPGPAPHGVGCSAIQGNAPNAPSAMWLLLLLPLLASRLRTRR